MRAHHVVYLLQVLRVLLLFPILKIFQIVGEFFLFEETSLGQNYTIKY